MINLGFTEDSTMWSRVWVMALNAGATAQEAEVAAAMAQWAVRDGCA